MKFGVVMDGTKVGGVRRGQDIEFPASVGEHRLKVTNGPGFTSPKALFHVEEAQILVFVCSPGRFWPPNRWLALDGPQ